MVIDQFTIIGKALETVGKAFGDIDQFPLFSALKFYGFPFQKSSRVFTQVNYYIKYSSLQYT